MIFIHLESACLSNHDPRCFCSVDFKITTSKELADNIKSFGSNKVPVKYHVDYDRNHAVVGTALESVGEWPEVRFDISEKVISYGPNIQQPYLRRRALQKSRRLFPGTGEMSVRMF